MKWYVERGLAVYVDDRTVSLTFQPSGRFGRRNDDLSMPGECEARKAEEQFYKAEKDNRCVVCGATQNYQRFHLIPSLFRQALPLQFQPCSHDVVVLCVPCHEHAAFKHTLSISKKFSIRFGVEATQEPSDTSELKKQLVRAKSAATALIKSCGRLPSTRASELKQRILSAYPENQCCNGVGLGTPLDSEAVALVGELTGNTSSLCPILDQEPELTLELLCKAQTWDERTGQRGQRQEVGKKVVDAWMAEGDISDLVRECRQHFLSTMSPQFLPCGWDVRHKVARVIQDRPSTNTDDFEAFGHFN